MEGSEGNNDRSDPSPLTHRIAVSCPIAVVCPESEVNTPLFSSVTRKDLSDGILVDASILETIICGISLCDDTDSENELERSNIGHQPISMLGVWKEGEDYYY